MAVTGFGVSSSSSLASITNLLEKTVRNLDARLHICRDKSKMKVSLKQPDAALRGIRFAVLVFLFAIFGSNVKSADTLGDFEGKANHWAPFVEPGFPFFSSVLDVRNVGSYP